MRTVAVTVETQLNQRTLPLWCTRLIQFCKHNPADMWLNAINWHNSTNKHTMQYEKNESFSVSEPNRSHPFSWRQLNTALFLELLCNDGWNGWCPVFQMQSLWENRRELFLYTAPVECWVHSIKFKTKSYLKRHGYSHAFLLPGT